MIRDLDDTIRTLFETRATPGSELAGADIVFDLPDAEWRASLVNLTVNGYLYDIRENREMRTTEPILQRNGNGSRATWRRAPARVDCAYCITAWSSAAAESVLEEHRLLSQVLRIMLQNSTIPADVLQGSLVDQIPPYPTVIASMEGVKNLPEFWSALNQQLKPSLTYVITLAVLLDESPLEGDMTRVVEQVAVTADNLDEFP